MEDPRRYCEDRALCLVSTVAATFVAFYLGLLLARFNALLLPLLLTLAVYPGFAKKVARGRLWDAALLAYAWALVATLLMALYAYNSGFGAASLVAKGAEYTREMFDWIKTGRGAEGDPSLFTVPKLVEIAVFSAATFATAGFAGLFMGAYLLDYMNFYVGNLLRYARPEHFLEVALLSWPIYAIVRVVGYVLLGTALSRVSWLLITRRSLLLEEGVKRMLAYSLAFIALDFLLKATVANAFYQPLLYAYTNPP